MSELSPPSGAAGNVPGPAEPAPGPPRRRADGPGWRYLVFGLAAAGSLVLVQVIASRARAPLEAPAEPGLTPIPVAPTTPVPPLVAEVDPATGETSAPFEGFAVRVETVPPGARVSIAGVPRGESPVFAGIDCAPGAPIPVRADLRGARAAASVTCRTDRLVTLTLQLRRAP